MFKEVCSRCPQWPQFMFNSTVTWKQVGVSFATNWFILLAAKKKQVNQNTVSAVGEKQKRWWKNKWKDISLHPSEANIWIESCWWGCARGHSTHFLHQGSKTVTTVMCLRAYKFYPVRFQRAFVIICYSSQVRAGRDEWPADNGEKEP